MKSQLCLLYSQLQIQQFVPLVPPPRDGTNYIYHHPCADNPAAADGEVGRALLSSCLAPFPPVRRDLVEKTSLEARPTSQSATLPSLGEKVRRPPLPPLLPPLPPFLAVLAAAPDNNTRGKRRHNINCVATAACQRQGGERRDKNSRCYHRPKKSRGKAGAHIAFDHF